MNFIYSIITPLIAIFTVVIVHELGHFFVARSLGVKVLKFSIGFGKAIWSWRDKSGTEYVIGILPLGGYVKMLGENSEVTSEHDVSMSYSSKPLWVRFVIVLAGPITNFLLAVFLFYLIFASGVNRVKPVIGQVKQGSIAAQAHLQPGDEILKVNEHNTRSWQRVIIATAMQLGNQNEMQLTVKPKNQYRTLVKHLNLKAWQVDLKEPDLLGSLGIIPYQPYVPSTVTKVVENSPAAKAGLLAGDKIVTAKSKKISNWYDLLKVTQSDTAATIELGIQRKGTFKSITVNYGPKHYLGIMSQQPKWDAGMIENLKYNVITAWPPAVAEVWTLTSFNAVVLTRMIMGKISLRALGGPIMIFQSAGKATQIGILAYLSFIAFLSVTLGFINLLPIPGLDGGHLLFQIIEGLRGKPLSEQVQKVSFVFGFGLLIFLMVQATLNDILRLF